MVYGYKERRRYSINRGFVGDYIGMEHHPGLCALLNRRERVEFALTVDKFDRRFKASRIQITVTVCLYVCLCLCVCVCVCLCIFIYIYIYIYI